MCLAPKELEQSKYPSIQPEGLVDKHHLICDVKLCCLHPRPIGADTPNFYYLEGRGGGGGGWELVSLFCPDDLSHRDVATSEAPDFAEFSTMVLARLLDARKTNSFSVLVSFQLCLFSCGIEF